jgi:hypothetical protein
MYKNLLFIFLYSIVVLSIIKCVPNDSTIKNKDCYIIALIVGVLSICLQNTLMSNNNCNKFESFTESPDSNNLNTMINDSKKMIKKIYQKENFNDNKKSKNIESSNSSNLSKSSKSSNTSNSSKSSNTSNSTKSSNLQIKNKKKDNLDILKPVNTKYNDLDEEISFPFSEKLINKTLNDILYKQNDPKVITNIQLNSKKSEYYEILIQLLQTNINAVYKYLKNNKFNKLNEIIMNIKIKRENDIKPDLTLNNLLKDKNSNSRELSATAKRYIKSMLDEGTYIDDNGIVKNMIDNDMKYSMYKGKEQEPLGSYDSTFTNKWDNDYVLLNTDRWVPKFNHSMYKCKTEKTCPVCPSVTSGYPTKLKEFDLARKILPPDMINTDYINEKLITGLA